MAIRPGTRCQAEICVTPQVDPKSGCWVRGRGGGGWSRTPLPRGGGSTLQGKTLARRAGEFIQRLQKVPKITFSGIFSKKTKTDDGNISFLAQSAGEGKFLVPGGHRGHPTTPEGQTPPWGGEARSDPPSSPCAKLTLSWHPEKLSIIIKKKLSKLTKIFSLKKWKGKKITSGVPVPPQGWSDPHWQVGGGFQHNPCSQGKAVKPIKPDRRGGQVEWKWNQEHSCTHSSNYAFCLFIFFVY